MPPHNVWAGDDRIATQRDDGGSEELKRYFLHKDLQGSTNMVTDYRGDTFQHHEYFPTGQVWVDESSTVFRTPYQYGGGYVDEVREILNFGSRWYDQNREMFYSPDPILGDDPLAVIDEPELRSAYSYAGSSPLTFIDPTGLERTRAQELRRGPAERFALAVIGDDQPKRAAAVAKSIEAHMPRFLVKALGPAGFLVEWFDARPLLEIDLTGDKVKTQWSLGTRLADELVSKLFRRKDAESTSDDATGADGGVNVGDQTGPQNGGTGPQGPEPPPARDGADPPPANRPPPAPPAPPAPPVASGDDGGARGDQ